MKTLNKTLGALTLSTAIVGAALAGPSNPTVSFGAPVASHQTAGGCPMIKTETKVTSIATSKGQIAVQKVTGHHHEGCIVSTGKVTCKATGIACATMAKS